MEAFSCGKDKKKVDVINVSFLTIQSTVIYETYTKYQQFRGISGWRLQNLVKDQSLFAYSEIQLHMHKHIYLVSSPEIQYDDILC